MPDTFASTAEPPYVPLRVHSAYSMRESLVRVPALLEQARAFGLAAIAIADRDNLFAAVPFVQLAAAADIQPILGALVSLADGTALTLLVAEPSGWGNLNRLITRRHLEGPLDWAALIAHQEGLIALCGGAEGAVQRALRKGDGAAAEKAARRLLAVYGDRAYLEAAAPEAGLRQLAERTGLRVVAAAPVRCVHEAEQEAWRVAQRGYKQAHDPQAVRALASPEAERARWRAWPEALAESRALAARCRFVPELGVPRLPCFDAAEDPFIALHAACEAGLLRRYGPAPSQAVQDRLAHELRVIEGLGFADYFLIVADVVEACRARGIAVGPGRGSGAGSLVAYLLGLSEICPLSLGLAFERFLNPERRELPDLDLDLCWKRRDEAIAYVYARYGADRTARLATITTLGARGALRLAGAGLGLEAELIDRVAKAAGHGSLCRELELSPALKALPWAQPPYAEWLPLALAFEGLPDHVGMHPCGVVVTPGPLTETVALMRGADGSVIAQADKDMAEALGLLKMDLLGNRNVTILAEALEAVNRAEGLALTPEGLSLDDEQAFELLRSGRAFGLYQLESSGVQGLLKQFQPVDLEDMTAITSLYRPGPIEGGIRDRYIARRHGKEAIRYAHPSLEPVLSSTYGTVLFQEQCLQAAVVFAGLSLGEADLLRRAMSKHERAAMTEVRARFVAGARALGRPEAAIAEVFDVIAHFAGFGFVKAHAAATQVLAIRQAYLKARWPLHYMAAVLSSGMGYYPPRVYLEDAVCFGATLAGPCLQRSEVGYSVEPGKVLRVGLGAVSGVGTAAAARAVAARAERPFASFADVRARSGLDREALTHLIQVGALDGFGEPRPALLWRLGAEAKAVSEPEAGSLRLFEPPPRPVLWKGPDYDAAQRRAFEREWLGFCLTPAVWPSVEGTTPLAAITGLPKGARVKVVAEVVFARRARTKDGKGMVLFLLLSDGQTHQSAILFPRAYERWYGHMGRETPRCFEGVVDRPEGEAQLVIEEVGEVGPAREARPA